TYEDFATQTARPLENGVPGNRLGGLGSGLTYIGNNTFLALPDRGPNAVPFNTCDDDTASYINRFHTMPMNLSASDPGSKYPITLTPMLTDTTLLYNATPLNYGAGCGAIGNGAPSLNQSSVFYFTGRSDGFDPATVSTDPKNARFDTESIRTSSDRTKVYISD